MRTNLTLVQLRAFVAVATTGGFTIAAKHLGVTQSTVSQTISALEEQLGVVLLARSRDGVVVTKVGEVVLADARCMVEAAERISTTAAVARGVEQGVLRIATVRSAARRILPSVLGAFRTSHPHVAVTLLEASDTEVADLVCSGSAQFGLAAAGGDGLFATSISEDSFVLVAPRGHTLLRQNRIPPAALNRAPFIMSSDGCEPMIMHILADGNARPDVKVRVADMATLLELVRAGMGVTVVPELALPSGEMLDLRVAPLDTPHRRTLLALEVAGRRRSAATAAFLELLRDGRRPCPGSLRLSVGG